MPETFLLPQYADMINASWRKTTQSVLETARLCFDANKDLKSKDRERLIKQLDFNASTFSKLVKIGSKYQLRQDSVKSLLPPSYSILYEVAKLNEGDLQAAVTKGVINPGMTRRDLDAWLGKGRGESSSPSEETSTTIVATVKVPTDYDDERRNQLMSALTKLEAKFGCNLERPRDREAEAYERMFERMNDYIRKEAKRYIAALKARRLQGLGKLSAAEKQRLWGFHDDEIAIAHDAGWDEVKAALDVVGNADQFERIRDEALRLYDVPENVVSTHQLEKPEDVLREFREANEIVRQLPNRQSRIDSEKFADLK